MLDSSEFDYEFMLKSYSVQDVALDHSVKHRVDSYASYNEILQEYKKVKKEYLFIENERETLYSNFVENLNIKNSLNQLQKIPNSKISLIHNKLLEVYQKMSNDSDNFVKAVTNSVKKIQNLENELDGDEIMKNKCECMEKIRLIKDEIVTKENYYDQIKKCDSSFEYNSIMQNLKKMLTNSFNNLEQMKLEILENEQHLSLLNKNIHFLTQRNREFQMQC